ncbi:MAG: hypothetical protein GOU97_02305 [Nanoarchaeota archaeon]|nr:hypothetical protein [Nanoarchaeota archaeon]
MKSMEAILTILFFMGSYVYFTQRVYTPTESFQRNPSRLGRVLLNSLDETGLLSQDLEKYDLRSLENKLYYIMPERFGYQVRAEYFSKITLNSTGGTWDAGTNKTINHFDQAVALTFNFPSYVDKNSVHVFSDGYSFDRNVDWNWYSVPIYLITNNTRVENGVIGITNLSLKTNGETVNKSAFVFQVDDTLYRLNVTNQTVFGSDMNVTVNVSLSLLPANTKTLAYFYYAGGSTSYNSNNAGLYVNSLLVNSSVATSVGEPQNSTRADTQFFIPLMNHSNKEFYLSYSIGTSDTDDYNSTLNTSYDNTNVTINFEKDNRGGTPPILKDSPKSNVHSISRLVNLEKDYSKVLLRMWYLW